MKHLASIFIIFTLLISVLSFSQNVKAETDENVVVEQVGTSGGIPAVNASIKNGKTVGQYTLVVTNPETGTTHIQKLDNSGKEKIFVVSNFTKNATYSYSLQLSEIEVAKGGVNLVSSKKSPAFVAVINGTDFTVDIKNANDYIGETITFTSGTYSGKIDLTQSNTQKAFGGAKGLTETVTFKGSLGDLATVTIQKGGKPPVAGTNEKPKPTPTTNTDSQPTQNENNDTSPSPENNPSVPSADTPTSAGTTNSEGTNPSKPVVGSNEIDIPGEEDGKPEDALATDHLGRVSVVSNPSNINNNIKLTLNKPIFELEDTIVVEAEVTNTENKSKSITVRLSADDESEVTLITLDAAGKGRAVFKIKVPQPSSKSVGITTYSIGGDKLDSTSLNYSIIGEVPLAEAEETDDYRIDYMSVDLTKLNTRKAAMSWYGAKNISNYDTRLKVKNNTTGDEHTYSVFIPDGESKINLNIVYDGPGIYTWELFVYGEVLTKSPFSTPVEVDGTPTSQNGLPVLKTLANVNLQSAELNGTDPNAVSGATIGEPLFTEVVADDFTQTDLATQEQANQQAEEGMGKGTIILIALAIILIAGGVAFFLWKRRQNNVNEDDEDDDFESYGAGDHDQDHRPGKGADSEFPEED